MALEVRRADRADVAAVAAVLAASFASFRAAYTPAAFAATTPDALGLRRRWDEGPVWLALDGDEALGTVAAVLDGSGCYIRSMAVVPSARGRGAGGALLRAVLEWAEDSSAPRAYLSTSPFLDSAIALYRKSGFVVTDEPPHTLLGTPLVTMELVLGAGPRQRRA